MDNETANTSVGENLPESLMDVTSLNAETKKITKKVRFDLPDSPQDTSKSTIENPEQSTVIKNDARKKVRAVARLGRPIWDDEPEPIAARTRSKTKISINSQPLYL